MRLLFALLILSLGGGAVQAQGLLIPTQKDVPPLALSGHEVKVTIEDQVAVTHVVQTFRNPTSRALEATYVFPVPKGASVKKFTMWVDGKEVPGELVEADKARTHLHRHRPPHARIRACSSTWATTSSRCASSPSRPTANRS